MWKAGQNKKSLLFKNQLVFAAIYVFVMRWENFVARDQIFSLIFKKLAIFLDQKISSLINLLIALRQL